MPSALLPSLLRSNQRNVGRPSGTVQILDKAEGFTFPSFDFGEGLSLQLVLPSDASDADLVLPAPNRFRQPCPAGTSPNATDQFAPCQPCEPGEALLCFCCTLWML